MNKKWDYMKLLPLFAASKLKNLKHFQKIIRDLEKAVDVEELTK